MRSLSCTPTLCGLSTAGRTPGTRVSAHRPLSNDRIYSIDSGWLRHSRMKGVLVQGSATWSPLAVNALGVRVVPEGRVSAAQRSFSRLLMPRAMRGREEGGK